MVNVHTWTRITRFDLQNLSISLGNAAMGELKNWPQNGDGRKVKDLTEQITRTLEATLDRRDLNYSFDIIEGVIERFRKIQENPFFQEFIARRIYRDRKGNTTTFEEALSAPLQKFTDFVTANRPPRPTTKTVKDDTSAEPPAKVQDQAELPQLADVVPAQKSAPLQFEVRNSRLYTKKQTAKADAQDRRNITSAKSALQHDANSVLEALRETNADPRLSSAVAEIRDIISTDSDIIRLGIVSLSCDSLVSKFNDQLPDIVSAKFEAFSASLSLFVGQFPEWQRFVENANSSINISERDIEVIYTVSTSLVQHLRQDTELSDPQVPKSIELLIEAIKEPKRASKRAVFGVVRTLENLIGTIFTGFGGLLGSSYSGVKEGLKTSAKLTAIALLLGTAAQSASILSPSVAKLIKSNWLEQASKIVENGLKE
jgi:hypothetical protein